jgi:hypothetical protein
VIREGRFRSPLETDIVIWRDRIAQKYADQLGEILSWDEASGFQQSEDVATSADLLLRYVAAVVDQRGPDARYLAGTRKPSHSEMGPVFDFAEQRGFTSGFPQLLLGAKYWLPFRRHMIIEEPDWNGTVARFGSVFHFVDELKELRTFISSADPGATVWTAERPDPPDDVLSRAWQASDTISRLCAVATTRRIPLWTTG